MVQPSGKQSGTAIEIESQITRFRPESCQDCVKQGLGRFGMYLPETGDLHIEGKLSYFLADLRSADKDFPIGKHADPARRTNHAERLGSFREFVQLCWERAWSSREASRLGEWHHLVGSSPT